MQCDLRSPALGDVLPGWHPRVAMCVERVQLCGRAAVCASAQVGIVVF
jgi:hypothetical protein